MARGNVMIRLTALALLLKIRKSQTLTLIVVQKKSSVVLLLVLTLRTVFTSQRLTTLLAAGRGRGCGGVYIGKKKREKVPLFYRQGMQGRQNTRDH